MVPVMNRPVMEHILRLLSGHGFENVVANLHWFPEVIEDRFGDGSMAGVELKYSREQALLGTAGGVRNAAGMLGDEFLVISGDALTDIDLSAMREFHRSHDGVATLATRRVEDTSGFGVVITDDSGRVQGFQEKPEPSEALSNLANCGIYMFDAAIFDFFPGPGESGLAGPEDPEGFADWAYDVFPALLESGEPFFSHEVDAYWNDIGTIPEMLRGNFDGLTGAISLDPGLPERVEGPVLIGEGAEIGSGSALTGPLVIGPDCRIGSGARLREAVLTEGASVEPGGYLVSGVLGASSS
jgi:mannose-1-phosphate guanylyltransferase/mannose-1-phosphate guanylyltransferase/phosphomannomutase